MAAGAAAPGATWLPRDPQPPVRATAAPFPSAAAPWRRGAARRAAPPPRRRRASRCGSNARRRGICLRAGDLLGGELHLERSRRATARHRRAEGVRRGPPAGAPGIQRPTTVVGRSGLPSPAVRVDVRRWDDDAADGGALLARLRRLLAVHLAHEQVDRRCCRFSARRWVVSGPTAARPGRVHGDRPS